MNVMQRSIHSLIISTPSISGRESSHRLHQSWTTLKGRPVPRHHRVKLSIRQTYVISAASQRSSLTFRQRWLSAQHDINHKAGQLRSWFLSLPPTIAVVNLIAMVRHSIDPYIRRYLAIRDSNDAWWAVRKERYREFIGDETKRKWQWQRRNEEELKFWTAIVQGIVGILATILWETITPVSFVIAVLPPLWVAWALNDNIFKSPIFYALLFMFPLKFPPGYPIRWI